jgi:hypothetical protein
MATLIQDGSMVDKKNALSQAIEESWKKQLFQHPDLVKKIYDKNFPEILKSSGRPGY